MTTENEDSPRGRRASLRRSRTGTGFGAGHNTQTDSLRMPGRPIGDEVDDAIEPENMNALVRRRAPVAPEDAPPGPEANNPRNRMMSVAMAGSPGYAREYRLELMGRLLMRGVGLDIIAQQLEISITTAERYRAELRERFRENARSLNIEEMVGNELAFYGELSQMPLRIASAEGTPTPMRLAAVRTALAANADKNRFLTASGVFDVLRFRQSAGEGELSDVQMLMQNTLQMMQSLAEPESPALGDEPEAPATPRVRRTRRAGGFEAPTFDDANASRSDQEVQEL